MAGEQNLLVMPKLGLTMTEGTLAKWEVGEGQEFRAGEIVVLIEGEKAAFEVEAPAAGRIEEILVRESQTVPVGTLLARWRLEGQAATPAEPAPPAAAPETTAPDTTVSRPASAPASAPGARLLATPLARRLARDGGIDLNSLAGSGPRNRIQAADVRAALASAAAAEQPAVAAPPKPVALPATADAPSGGRVVAPSPIERTMAARVSAAKREIPHFYMSVDIDIAPLSALRASLNDAGQGRRYSVTHLLVAGLVHAFRAVPRMNAVWSEEGIVHYDRIDIGIAVDTERGLMSPVVKDLARDRLSGLADKVDDVIARARQGTLRPDDHAGAALTLSNAGMHRVRYMTSIIVPGQSSILGVGAVEECFRPDETGSPVLRRELGIVLSADHRVHTGVGVLEFLRAFERALHDPLQLLT